MNAENQKTILLVEDEFITAKGEKKTLEKYGYKVITANSGEEAVAIVEKTPGIDLILMDINLGAGIDGTEAAAMILNKRDIPVVFLSSHTEPEVVEKTEKITSYGYVVKNSSSTVLDASIKMAFKLFEAKIKEKEKETQRTAALAALRESESFNRGLVENLPDYIVVYGPDGKILYVNPASAKVMGYDADKLVGTPVLSYVAEEYREEVVSKITDRRKGVNIVPYEIDLLTHGGLLRSVIVKGSLIQYHDSPATLILFVDITEHKQAEAEIKRQLSEKEILLKEVHHRIKNNIASIGSLISRHMQSITNPEAIAVLQDAIGRVNGMRILYDKLLLSEDYKDIPVKNYVESLVDTVVALFPDKAKLTIDMRIADFQLDSKRLFPLGIIINELITNIMKHAFINKDSGVIKMSLTHVANHVLLSVQDNGHGLPAGFDINEAKGFGLMLVKMLSQQLGGSFSMEKHKGTRCKVEFKI